MDTNNKIMIASRMREGKEFLGNACASWEDWGAGLCCGEEMVMGEWLEPVFPSLSSSSFFLDVGQEPPYARGREGLPDCGR